MTRLPQEINRDLLHKEYCCHMRQCWPELLRFALSLSPHQSDAEEILQEASLVLWQKYDEFQKGTSFVHWAKKVVYYEVLTFRKKRRSWLQFSSKLVEKFAAEKEAPNQHVLSVHDALERCTLKLSEKDRNLIELRYQESQNAKEISQVVKRSTEGIYKALKRIRIALRDCIQRELARNSRHE